MQKTKVFPAERLRPPEMRCLSIGVTLRSRAGVALQPPPERVLIASPRHTFADLALAIDEAFGRWELGRGREFAFDDGSRAGEVVDGRRRGNLLDDCRCRLYRLQEDERFVYVAQADERWEHECLVVGWVDPDEILLEAPSRPVVYQASVRGPAASAAGSAR
ncbi:MAG: hypothetical protein M3507_09250 [Actinomycetota bacterium]|jgi:hypothetical protein|nr:hypothetical protein [Actinomycetota bacterium]